MTLPISGAAAWYDASQITGLTNGESVATWPDLSGNGRTMIQGNVGPQYKTTGPFPVGLPSLHFIGSPNLALYSDGFVGNQHTAFIVIKAQTSGMFWALRTNTSETCGLLGGWAGASADAWTLYEYAGSMPETGNSLDGLAHVISYQVNGGSSLIRVDGTQGNGDLGDQEWTRLYIGGSNSEYFLGDIGEVIIYTSVLTSDQILATEAYLTAKWTVPAPTSPSGSGFFAIL